MNIIQVRYYQKACKTCSLESFPTKNSSSQPLLRAGIVLEAFGAVLVIGRDTKLGHKGVKWRKIPKVARAGLCSRTSGDVTNPVHVKVLDDTG